MSTVSELRPLQVLPGVEPNTDNTALSTQHYTFSDKIRFVKSLPQKLGGWLAVVFTGETLAGAVRSIFPLSANQKGYEIIGSSSALYSLVGGQLDDITPTGLLPGAVDQGAVSGYGAGLYGIGLYGVNKVSSTGISYPRIWFTDRFGDLMISTPGNQLGVYQWDGDVLTPADLVPNAPTEVNYAFVSDNILVTFGADNVQNRIRASDQGDIEEWTSSSTNQVFALDVQNAGRLVSHVPVQGKNLIFTANKTFTFRYIGLPLVWELKEIDNSIGIIAPMARVNVGGIAYWMGQRNFYMYRGDTVEVIPSNSSKQSTLLNYVFGNLNISQQSKCFAWYNEKYHEIWFHYPSTGSNEPNSIARLSLYDFSWVPDTMDRTAAEYPNQGAQYPYLCSSAPALYFHETGNDNDTVSMPFTLTTNDITGSKKCSLIAAFIPDSIQNGNIGVNVSARLWPQSSSETGNNDYIVGPTSERIQIRTGGRFWNYTVSGDELGQFWRAGYWVEDLQPSGNE